MTNPKTAFADTDNRVTGRAATGPKRPTRVAIALISTAAAMALAGLAVFLLSHRDGMAALKVLSGLWQAVSGSP